MSFTEPIDTSTPSGTESLSLGDERIRELKDGIQQLLGVDHETTETGTVIDSSDSGAHNKVTLLRQSSAPSPLAGVETAGILYGIVDADSGNTELFYQDEQERGLQLTKDDRLFMNLQWLDNGVYLRCRNDADTDFINMITISSNDNVEIYSALGNEASLASTTPPVGSSDIANKLYVDTTIDDEIADNTVKYIASRISSFGSIGDYGSTFASDTQSLVSGERYLIMVHGSCSSSDSSPNFALIVKRPSTAETMLAAVADGATNDHNHNGKAFAMNATYVATETGTHTVYIRGNISRTTKGYGIVTIRI